MHRYAVSRMCVRCEVAGDRSAGPSEDTFVFLTYPAAGAHAADRVGKQCSGIVRQNMALSGMSICRCELQACSQATETAVVRQLLCSRKRR